MHVPLSDSAVAAASQQLKIDFEQGRPTTALITWRHEEDAQRPDGGWVHWHGRVDSLEADGTILMYFAEAQPLAARRRRSTAGVEVDLCPFPNDGVHYAAVKRIAPAAFDQGAAESLRKELEMKLEAKRERAADQAAAAAAAADISLRSVGNEGGRAKRDDAPSSGRRRGQTQKEGGRGKSSPAVGGKRTREENATDDGGVQPSSSSAMTVGAAAAPSRSSVSQIIATASPPKVAGMARGTLQHPLEEDADGKSAVLPRCPSRVLSSLLVAIQEHDKRKRDRATAPVIVTLT